MSAFVVLQRGQREKFMLQSLENLDQRDPGRSFGLTEIMSEFSRLDPSFTKRLHVAYRVRETLARLWGEREDQTPFTPEQEMRRGYLGIFGIASAIANGLVKRGLVEVTELPLDDQTEPPYGLRPNETRRIYRSLLLPSESVELTTTPDDNLPLDSRGMNALR